MSLVAVVAQYEKDNQSDPIRIDVFHEMDSAYLFVIDQAAEFFAGGEDSEGRTTFQPEVMMSELLQSPEDKAHMSQAEIDFCYAYMMPSGLMSLSYVFEAARACLSEYRTVVVRSRLATTWKPLYGRENNYGRSIGRVPASNTSDVPRDSDA